MLLVMLAAGASLSSLLKTNASPGPRRSIPYGQIKCPGQRLTIPDDGRSRADGHSRIAGDAQKVVANPQGVLRDDG